MSRFLECGSIYNIMQENFSSELQFAWNYFRNLVRIGFSQSISLNHKPKLTLTQLVTKKPKTEEVTVKLGLSYR